MQRTVSTGFHRGWIGGFLASAALILGIGTLPGCAYNETKYLDPPAPLAAAGDWPHPPSGMIFPAEVAGFQRVTIARISQTQPDVAVSYNLTGDDGPVAATIYLVPAPALPTVGLAPEAVASARARACQANFQTAKQQISMRHVTRQVQQRAVSLRRNGRLRPGRLVVLAYPANFAGRRQPVRTELAAFCFAGDGWSLEFRFTYPDGLDPEARIAGFLQALSWTGRLAD